MQEGRLWFSTEPGAPRDDVARDGDGRAVRRPRRARTPPPRPTVRPGRLALWRAAARMFAAHPLPASAPTTSGWRTARTPGSPDADARTHSNNMYLEMLAGGGLLVGAGVRLAALAVGGVRARRRARRRGRRRRDRASALAAAVARDRACTASVDSFLSFAPTYVLFSLTLGCAVACARGMETWPDAHRV